MSLSSYAPRAIAAAATLLALSALSGCAFGNLASTASTEPTVLPAISGIIHGGPNPIIGARVVLYATSSAGYGAAPSLVEEANQQGASLHQDTDGNGSFQFPGGVTCPAGEYVYVVAYGGNTGANANNPNSVLMTALGSCSSLYSGTTYTGSNIWIDELTTVAAGYALNNFMTIAGDPVNGFTVNIGAPATNHATSGCVSNSYYPTCTTTSAAGLAHAFGIATSLVNTTNGVAQTFTSRLMPVPAINTLGNILQACVNTTGGGSDTTSGAATSTTSTHDGTACGKLFSFTAYGTHIATNTLQAVVNLVKRPASNSTQWATTCASGSTGVTTGVSCLYNLAGSIGFYAPTLTFAPPDWMLGITYTNTVVAGPVTTCSTTTQPGFVYPYYLTLDINDNVFVANSDTSSQTCYNTIGMTYNGTEIFATLGDTTNKVTKTIATDAMGHVLVPNQGNALIRVYDTNPATLAGTLDSSFSASLSGGWGIVVDPNNSFYIDTNSTPSSGTAPFMAGYSLGGTQAAPTYTAISSVTTNAVYGSNTPMQGYELTMDSKGNIWAGTGSTSSPTVVVLPNVGQNGSAPTYTTPLVVPASPGSGSTGNTGYGSVTDANGNTYAMWSSSISNTTLSTGLYKFTPNAGATITSVTNAGVVAGPPITIPKYMALDGNNVVWIPQNANGSTGLIYGYDATNNTAIGSFKGCYPTSLTANTSCTGTSSTSSLIYGARSISIDSTGSIWIPNSANARVVQLIGVAAPTWPLLSLLKTTAP